MEKDIALILPMRENSTRVKDKMLRPLSHRWGGTETYSICLASLALGTLCNIAQSDNNPFNRIAVAISPKDKRLMKLAKEYKRIEIIERDDNSVSNEKETVAGIHSYLKKIDNEYIMFMNACMPFVKANTYIKWGTFFRKSPYISFMPVLKRRNYFFDGETKKLLTEMNPECTSTTKMNATYECIHTGFGFQREKIFKENRYWTLTPYDPYIMQCQDSKEWLDVDEEWQWKLVKDLLVGQLHVGMFH